MFDLGPWQKAGVAQMKILNLYAGIGGNRALWGDEHEITAVEYDPGIAAAYAKLWPADRLVVGDAHQYLLDHYNEFDFIWSSPPCPTHSKLSPVNTARGRRKYPDMTLYQEIIWLKHFAPGRWLVENVEPFYTPLISPRLVLDRHCLWSNFDIPKRYFDRKYEGALHNQSTTTLAKAYGITLPAGTRNPRKVLRNAVLPEMGLHILNAAMVEQPTLL